MKVSEIINNHVMPTMIKEMSSIDGYVVGLVRGKLKTGQIVREATESDITPMELDILKMLGEDAVKEKLNNMPKIEEYFDDVLFVAFDLCSQKLFESINESELNLMNDSSNEISFGTNPMLGAIDSLLSENKSTTFDEDKSSELDIDSLNDDLKESSKGIEEISSDEEDFPF